MLRECRTFKTAEMEGTDAFSLVSNVREKPIMNQRFNSELSRNTAGIKGV